MLRGFSKLLTKMHRNMKKIIAGLALVAFFGCQDNENISSEFTGNEMVYALEAGPDYAVSGTATFREKKDGSTVISINLTGTAGTLQHPVHLHLGNINTPDADVAALLNPVLGSTGTSETILTLLADESTITYTQLLTLDACIKIHLAESGLDRDIILAGGNIGSAKNYSTAARQAFGVCKSE